MPSVIFDLTKPIKSRFIKRHLRQQAREYLGLSKWTSRSKLRKVFVDKFLKQARFDKADKKAFLSKLNPIQVHQVNVNTDKQHQLLEFMDMFNIVENVILNIKIRPLL